jgi:hypothetical protein
MIDMLRKDVQLPPNTANLQLTRLDNGWFVVVLDLATAAAGCLEGLDNVQ